MLARPVRAGRRLTAQSPFSGSMGGGEAGYEIGIDEVFTSVKAPGTRKMLMTCLLS